MYNFKMEDKDIKPQNTMTEIIPLKSNDYIAKIASIRLNEVADYKDKTKVSVVWSVILLPYKLRAEDDEMLDVNKGTVKPLTRWLFKDLNVSSVGINSKTNQPMKTRSFILNTLGVDNEDFHDIEISDIVVLTPEKRLANKEESELYKKQFIDYIETRSKDGFTLFNRGFCHVPDIRYLEGKYVGLKVAYDAGKKMNKVEDFLTVSKKFVADKQVESEAMEKFAISFQKMLDKKAVRDNNKGTTQIAKPSNDDDVDMGAVEF